jgi:hypothetical protein
MQKIREGLPAMHGDRRRRGGNLIGIVCHEFDPGEAVCVFCPLIWARAPGFSPSRHSPPPSGDLWGRACGQVSVERDYVPENFSALLVGSSVSAYWNVADTGIKEIFLIVHPFLTHSHEFESVRLRPRLKLLSGASDLQRIWRPQLRHGEA